MLRDPRLDIHLPSVIRVGTSQNVYHGYGEKTSGSSQIQALDTTADVMLKFILSMPSLSNYSVAMK